MLERKKSAYPKYAADGIIWKWNSEMSKNIIHQSVVKLHTAIVPATSNILLTLD